METWPFFFFFDIRGINKCYYEGYNPNNNTGGRRR